MPEPQQEGENQSEVNVEDIATEEEADRILPEGARRSLRSEDASLFQQLRHKPKNPYGDACRQAQLRMTRNSVGPCNKDASHWGQHVAGCHVVAVGDMGKGLNRSVDAFVVADLYSGLRVAFPSPDKSAESTTMAMRTFYGSREMRKLYVE